MINKEGIKYDNWPLLSPFENDLVRTYKVLKIIIIQTVAQQNNMSDD